MHCCRTSHQGIEDILDIIGSINKLDPDFKESIPDNFRALLTVLEKEFGVEMTLEIVYDMCHVCYWVYRDTETDDPSAHLDECPICSAPRYKDTGKSKPQPQMQVSRSQGITVMQQC